MHGLITYTAGELPTITNGGGILALAAVIVSARFVARVKGGKR